MIKNKELIAFIKDVGFKVLVFVIMVLVVFGIASIINLVRSDTEVKPKPINEDVRTLEIELRGDSIKINNIIKKYEEEVKNVSNLDDSASVKLFIKLVQAE